MRVRIDEMVRERGHDHHAVAKKPLNYGEIFWLIIVLGVIFAVVLPVWLKLVITLAEWSWGLIG